MVAIITKSRYLADQPLPVGADKLMMVGAWCEALEELSTSQLEEYYLRATRRKANTFPVNALDIIAEWNRLREQRHWDTLMPEHERGKY